MPHVGIEKDEIGRHGLGFQVWPVDQNFQSDGGQLPRQRLHQKVRTVQDDGARAAKVLDAHLALHDTTRSTGAEAARISGRRAVR